jgi:SAM-dependent methyltransferase
LVTGRCHGGGALMHVSADAAHSRAGPLMRQQGDTHELFIGPGRAEPIVFSGIPGEVMTTLLEPPTGLTDAWNEVAAELSAIPLAPECVRYAAAIRPIAALPRSARILEAGCGAGRILRALDGLGFANLTGVEISASRLEYVAAAGPMGAKLVCSSEVPFEDGAFDAVVSAAVIEHVVDPWQWLGELARVTKPGGLVSIATDTYIWHWLKLLGLYKSVQPLDRAIWPATLARWGRQAGLELVECGGFVNVPDQRWYFLKQFRRLISWRRWWFKLTGIRTGRPRPTIDYPSSDEVPDILEATNKFHPTSARKFAQCIWSYECYYWFRKK